MVVVGASAGGIEPLRRVVAGVPAELPVAFIVALHLRADSFSALRRPRPRHQLPVGHAVDGEPLRGGQVYVRPPDVDVIVRSAELHLVHGPTGNGHRPAIGPLFRSAAQAYGERAIGVVVSGVLDDGTAGLAMVKHAGGVAIVQSPTDAVYAAMPRNAMRRVDADFVVPSGDIGPLVARLVAEGSPPAGEQVEAGADVVQEAIAEETPASGLHDGGASGLTCPDCSGARWEVHEGASRRSVFASGTAWTETGLFARQTANLEAALWIALRVLGERAELTRRIHERAPARARARGTHVSRPTARVRQRCSSAP